ncbi:MAG: ABC transporter permease, partial [Bacteroidales bacterium]|nr:ABC transporter permease [Bacteroidales bacterium]
MRWFDVFIKGMKEQIRDYWILVMTVVMAPLFIAIYFLMVETETPAYDILLVNRDVGIELAGQHVNLGDSLVYYGQMISGSSGMSMLHYGTEQSRDKALEMLRNKHADVVVVIPENLSFSVLDTSSQTATNAQIELVGDVTQMEYIIGAVWTEELINQFILGSAGIQLPITWKETTLGHSGQRSMFELYVPGLLILSIIMIIFSASAAIVRESESRTLERLKISRLTALEFLGGISLVQILIAVLSLALALLTALALGYT